MMTPAQLKQYEFKAAGRNAYKADDVDSFFAEVLISYEKIYRENGELIKRMSLLADRLQKFKNDEADAMNTQKAADAINKEADNILASAKNEAETIKAEAEKQAIADSELLLSMARDKAEDIMKKAKQKAQDILMAANDSASNTVGAANRTITSESIHYDMLKKEVSEFRSSILAQYKAHIELISKLPELAIQEAAKIEMATPPVADVSVENLESKLEEEPADDAEDSIIEVSDSEEFASEDVAENDTTVAVEAEAEALNENDDFEAEIPVDQTTIVFDLNEQSQDVIDDEPAVQDIPVSKKFTVNTDDLMFDGFDDVEEVSVEEVVEEDLDDISSDDEVEDIAEDVVDDNVIEEDASADEVAEESESFSFEIEDDDDGPDVILSFDVVQDDKDVVEADASDISVEEITDVIIDSESQETVGENPVVENPVYEDVYSNTDTEQFDDLIIAFDDEPKKIDFKTNDEPSYQPAVNNEESAQSRRNRYAKMFGDDYEDEGEDDSIASFFGSIETITVDESEDTVDKKRKSGFFRRKK